MGMKKKYDENIKKHDEMNDELELECHICRFPNFYPSNTKCCRWSMCLICVVEYIETKLNKCPGCRETPITSVWPKNVGEFKECINETIQAKLEKKFSEEHQPEEDKERKTKADTLWKNIESKWKE